MTRDDKRKALEARLAEILTSPPDDDWHRGWTQNLRLFDFGLWGYCLVRRTIQRGELTFEYTWIECDVIRGIDEYLQQVEDAV